MPSPVEALPCGSRSTISVRCPSSARQAPRLIVVVVLPTPPFWLATAITRGAGRPGGLVGPRAPSAARHRRPASGGSSAGAPADRSPDRHCPAGADASAVTSCSTSSGQLGVGRSDGLHQVEFDGAWNHGEPLRRRQPGADDAGSGGRRRPDDGVPRWPTSGSPPVPRGTSRRRGRPHRRARQRPPARRSKPGDRRRDR